MNILFCLLAYLVGSVPTGYIFFRYSEKKDIRGFGSGATGGTNVLRLKGWKYALPVVVLDVLKGALPAYLGLRLFHNPDLAIVAALSAIIGHCYPVYISFMGGKGVATTMGAFLVLSPIAFVISLCVFVIVIGITRYVSLGSILAACAFPVSTILLHGQYPRLGIWSLAILAVIIIRHRGNIQRLLKGEERKLGQKVRVS
jgi:glycerol-3-phosphate acyltransferase PlsY